MLEKNWSFTKRRILFRRWILLFDSHKEKMVESPVWVKLPGIPMQFWIDSAFTSIGNTLCKILDIDRSFLRTRDCSVACIMVSINPKEVLADAMNLKYQGLEFIQTLYYEKLPFICHRCHKYGHLARECPLGHRHR